MTVITESELREMWKNGNGQIPAFPSGTKFSAAALDFIKSQQIKIDLNQKLPADFVPPANPSRLADTSWDKPATFPVSLSGPIPVCTECGQPLQVKPEHMTQIDSGHFASKTSPRLIFRGHVDSLHAYFMLTSAVSRRFGLIELSDYLDTLSAYCREIMSAEYNSRPASRLTLLGKSEEELHNISHWPEKYLGISHLTPGKHDHEILHWLNLLRTQCREVEIIALQTFPPALSDTDGVGSSIARALNRLSSAVYVLELYFQSGLLNWKVTG